MEITIVEIIDGEELDSFVRGFADKDKAKEVFKKELRKRFQIHEGDLDEFVKSGECTDDEHTSIRMKDIRIE